MGKPTTTPTPPDLRTTLAEQWRARAHDLAERLGVEPTHGAIGNDLERAAQLERGEPVHIAAWELPREAGRGTTGWYIIEPHGTLQPADERTTDARPERGNRPTPPRPREGART